MQCLQNHTHPQLFSPSLRSVDEPRFPQLCPPSNFLLATGLERMQTKFLTISIVEMLNAQAHAHTQARSVVR